MKVLLKIVKWIVISLVLLTVLAVVGLYGFLKYGLTGTVQQYVLPEVLTQAGVETELEHVELDLFKGAFSVKGLKIKNPAGFVEPDMMTVDQADVMVRLQSLLKQDPIEVQWIKLHGAKLHVVRNREKVINIQQLQTELAAKLPPSNAEPSEPTDASQPMESTEGGVAESPAVSEQQPLPALVLKSLEADLVVDYVDQSERAPVKQGELTVNLRGRNLATATVTDIPWGELYLISNIKADRYGFPINLNLLVAPFDTPETLSFDLKGAPFEMDASLVNKSIKKLGIESEKVRLDVDVKARNGVFVQPDSVVGTELKGVKLDKSVAGIELTASALKFKLPVFGTVMKPVIDWKDSINKVVLANRSVLVKEVGAQFIDKAVKSKDKAGIQALGQMLGLDLGLTPSEEIIETPKTESSAKDAASEVFVPDAIPEPESATEPAKELSTEDKVIGGVLRVLEESKKDGGDATSSALKEVLNIFGN